MDTVTASMYCLYSGIFFIYICLKKMLPYVYDPVQVLETIFG